VHSPTNTFEMPVTSPTASLPVDSVTWASTTEDDWTNSCDESSSSLAQRLPCVTPDASTFCSG
jgi:hypothetical protein